MLVGRRPGLRPDEDRHLPRTSTCRSSTSPSPTAAWTPPQMEGLHHQLLRVPLPLHQRHPPRRVAEHPGRRPDEALLPPRHRHGPGDGRDGRLRQPLARLHAAGHRAAVRHALRRRQRAGRLPRPLAARRKTIGEIQDQALLQGPADVRQPAGRLGAAAVRRQPADHRRPRRPRPAARPTTSRPTRWSRP